MAPKIKSSKSNVVMRGAIIIERRDTVAIITPDPDGEMPMMEAAFRAAADYIARNYDNNPINLVWEWGNDKFHVTVGPKPADGNDHGPDGL